MRLKQFVKLMRTNGDENKFDDGMYSIWMTDRRVFVDWICFYAWWTIIIMNDKQDFRKKYLIKILIN